MITKQLSVFLENKKGRLFAVANILAENNINIRALSLADTAEYGILRLIVDKPEEGKKLLTESGVVVRVSNVLAIRMNDVPGGTIGILEMLAKNDINIEYMYASVSQTSGQAVMVLQVNDLQKADRALRENGIEDAAFH